MADHEGAVNPIDAVTTHFRAALDGKPRVIHVPEWSLDVYVFPETCEQRDSYYHLIAANRYEGFVEIILKRARKADGSPLFKSADKITLMKRASPDVVLRLANDIFSPPDPTGEQLGKS